MGSRCYQDFFPVGVVCTDTCQLTKCLDLRYIYPMVLVQSWTGRVIVQL